MPGNVAVRPRGRAAVFLFAGAKRYLALRADRAMLAADTPAVNSTLLGRIANTRAVAAAPGGYQDRPVRLATQTAWPRISN
jgi:hypothetical protein